MGSQQLSIGHGIGIAGKLIEEKWGC